MPEGPEIKRAADRIAKAIAQQPITSLFFAFEHLKHYEQILRSHSILSVQPRGKALLIRFDNQLSIYSHNQLYGVWMIRNAQDYPQTKRQLRLAIHTPQKSALLYSASDIAVLDEVAVALHPFLSKLGLDLLDASTTVEQVIQRFQAKPFARRGLTGLLLDQHFLCGLGNYLRSEVLFVARVHPTFRPIDCSDQQIAALASAAIAVTQQSYLSGGITNDLQLAQQLKAAGKRRRDYRHYVFGRDGKPCYMCGTAIVREMLAGRRCYYCPTCQPAKAR
jgi:endonuclease VIII